MLADWPADSAKFMRTSGKEFRDGIRKEFSAIDPRSMDNLPLLGDEAKHRSNLERLKAAAEMSMSSCPSDPPLVETVLGGKAGFV